MLFCRVPADGRQRCCQQHHRPGCWRRCRYRWQDRCHPRWHPELNGVDARARWWHGDDARAHGSTSETQRREEARKYSCQVLPVQCLLTTAKIYATSEERKQRNRQAQAAFRERRTEYIKQLEATIKQNEETLGTLQQSHRSAADECLMLRYKNSLLERILLEKGTMTVCNTCTCID